MSLPQFQTDDTSLGLLQNTWAKQLNPLLALPLSQSLILSNVPIQAGVNTINHMLDRNLQGWFIVRQRGQAVIYDNQNNNLLPDKTLILISTSGVSVDLVVF